MLKLRGKLAPPDRPSMIRKNGSNCLDRANGSQKNLFIANFSVRDAQSDVES